MCQREPQGHSAATIEAGQKNPRGTNIQPCLCYLNGFDNPLLGEGHMGLGLSPGKARLAARRGVGSRAADGDAHVVPQAHQRHDSLELVFLVSCSMQPNDKRVGVVGLVVDRRRTWPAVACSRSAHLRKTQLPAEGQHVVRERVLFPLTHLEPLGGSSWNVSVLAIRGVVQSVCQALQRPPATRARSSGSRGLSRSGPT